jgi:hypothetical protein
METLELQAEITCKHLRPSLDANTSLIPPTSDVFACWEVWFLEATADFQGVVCEWCLPGFMHDDGYSFAKYSQIQNSEMKSRISNCYVQSLSFGLSNKVKQF